MKIIVALIFLAIFALIDSKITLPLRRHEGLKNKLIREGKFEEYQKRLHNSRSRSRKGVTQLAELYDYFNDFFSHHVQLGTPPQTFIIRPDTSSSDIWVMDKNLCTADQCKGFPSLTSNFNRTLFDSTASSTYKTVNSKFTSGVCFNGSLGSDMFTMAGFPSVTQQFGLCYDVDKFMGLHPFDGYLGLAWPALAADNVTPVVQNYIGTSNFASPVFSVYLLTNNNGSITYGRDTAGSITYGGLDTYNCAPTVSYVPLSSKTYWQFTVSSFNFGTYTLPSNQQAIVSTAEAIIILPDNVLTKIVGQINATFFPIVDGAQYLVSCKQAETFPSLNFTIGGMVYSIPGPGYVDQLLTPPDTCALRIETPEGFGFGPSWVLGAPFHRQYCVHHDVGNSQIGFSQQTPDHINRRARSAENSVEEESDESSE